MDISREEVIVLLQQRRRTAGIWDIIVIKRLIICSISVGISYYSLNMVDNQFAAL